MRDCLQQFIQVPDLITIVIEFDVPYERSWFYQSFGIVTEHLARDHFGRVDRQMIKRSYKEATEKCSIQPEVFDLDTLVEILIRVGSFQHQKRTTGMLAAITEQETDSGNARSIRSQYIQNQQQFNSARIVDNVRNALRPIQLEDNNNDNNKSLCCYHLELLCCGILLHDNYKYLSRADLEKFRQAYGVSPDLTVQQQVFQMTCHQEYVFLVTLDLKHTKQTSLIHSLLARQPMQCTCPIDELLVA